MSPHRVANVAVIIVAILVTIYFLADDTPVDWLVRLGFAGAIVAGLGVALYALIDVVDGWPRSRPPGP